MGSTVVTCSSVVFWWGRVGYFIRFEGDYRGFNKFPSRTITEIERGSQPIPSRIFEDLKAHDFATRADSREMNARRSYHSALIYRGWGSDGVQRSSRHVWWNNMKLKLGAPGTLQRKSVERQGVCHNRLKAFPHCSSSSSLQHSLSLSLLQVS